MTLVELAIVVEAGMPDGPHPISLGDPLATVQLITEPPTRVGQIQRRFELTTTLSFIIASTVTAYLDSHRRDLR